MQIEGLLALVRNAHSFLETAAMIFRPELKPPIEMCHENIASTIIVMLFWFRFGETNQSLLFACGG
eukprot:1310969-Ditylum_brightwellii.AAC.4